MRQSISDPVETVLDALRGIEAETGIFEEQWHGVPYWSAFRPFIIEQLLQRVSNTGPAQQAAASSSAKRVRRAAVNLSYRNPWFKRKRARYLVARWERSQVVDRRETEPLSEAVGEALGQDTIFLDATGACRGDGRNTWSVEAINLSARIRRTLAKPSKDVSTIHFLRSVSERLRAYLRVEIDLGDLLQSRVHDLAIRADIYEKLLAKAEIAEVLIVVAYAHQGLVLGAKRLGVPVTDIQHGLLNFAYDGLGLRKDCCVPDKLALFGDRWSAALKAPDRIKWASVGAPHIRPRLDAVVEATREAYILIISQPMVRDQLMSFAITVARHPDAPQIVYRLHPGDNREACEQALASSGLDPSKIILSSEGGAAETLRLQANAHCQIGAFSTAILEGIALGTSSFIYPTAGYSLILPYIDGGVSRIVSSASELLGKIGDPAVRSGTSNPDELFAHFDPDAIRNLVDYDVRLKIEK